jgi:plastocyanin
VLAAASKVPFYVAGGALAGWAVLVAAFGVMRPEFPGSARAARLVMLASALLVGATVTAAVATAGEEGDHAAATSLDLTADPGGQTVYDTTEVTLLAGTRAINLTNDSPVPHNVTVAAGSRIVAQTRTVTRGTTSITARLAPGSYAFYCSVDAHRAGGMEGTLTVR